MRIFFRGNKGALRIPSLSFQYLRRPGCTAKLLCFLIAGEFESHRLHQLCFSFSVTYRKLRGALRGTKPLSKPIRGERFSINYCLAPKDKFPAAAEDVERVIEYVKKNAARYKVDYRRIALIGESSGGHLVSYVGARNREKSKVAGVVSLYGIHDFVSACIAWKPIPTEVFQLFGLHAIDAETASVLMKASPVAYVKRDMPDARLEG
jgi:cephalosporin-C deacetylase-like acetyl esterase